MKRWLLSLVPCFALLLLAGKSHATVDGGITAELLGTAAGGRLAVIAESSIQEECIHASCTVYVIDTTAPAFKRLMMVDLPPRWELLKKEHCAGKTPQQCSQLVSTLLLDEDSARRKTDTSEQSLLLTRYLSSLSVWQRAQLAPVSPPPAPHPLTDNENYVAGGPELILSEVPPPRKAGATGASQTNAPLTLRLKERWSAPSFRATTEDDRYCNPSNLPSCHQEERWQDGARLLAWVCSSPNSGAGPSSPPPKSTPAPLDCAARASFVRVEASWGKAPVAQGRSSWVEPGRLAQAAMSLIHERTLDLKSLSISRHSVSIYPLAHSTLVVGGFAHGMYANGSWFPLVVALPHERRVRD